MKALRTLLSALLVAGFAQDFTPVQTAHGWKTSRVEAVRYKNSIMGYNIGFKYPMNPDDCDRAELSEFMEKHSGWVYEGGGYSGAEMFVKFKDVKDRESADRKLKEILPALSKLVASL